MQKIGDAFSASPIPPPCQVLFEPDANFTCKLLVYQKYSEMDWFVKRSGTDQVE